MQPDFQKKTIDTVARRASYICSNPDCRVSTVGANSDPEKSTVIGEAAHIFGARASSKRYNLEMTDTARAEITNAIWLCCNCHKLIDTDSQEYSSDILFVWREQHERYTQSELGNPTDRIQLEQQNSQLSLFESYPPLIRRIVIDKPEGWEWRLTAELMRYHNRYILRKIKDLRDGLYVRPPDHISSDEVIEWVSKRLGEASNMLGPITNLVNRLNDAWGPPGEPGDVEEIYHISCLIRDNLEQIVRFEEQVYFVSVPEEYEKLIDSLKGLLGTQVSKLADIPISLDEIVSFISTDHGSTAEEPITIKKSIEFELPSGWERQFYRELKRAKRYSQRSEGIGVWSTFAIFVALVWLIFF